MSSTALSKMSRKSCSGGLGNVTFDIHMFPLMPGSFKLDRCCFEIGVGLGWFRMARMVWIVSSVLKSHFDEFGDNQRQCHSADLSRKGT